MHHPPILVELALVFTAAVALALPMARLRLPPVIAYFVTGALLGPYGFGLVPDAGSVAWIAEGGVALLLFSVGLELSLQELRHVWRRMLAAGGVQVLLSTALGLAVARAYGAAWSEAVVWGFLLAVSSTAVVLRLLQDRGEAGTPQGKVAIGVLVFQDLCVVPMMLVVDGLGRGGPGGLAWPLAKAGLIVVLVVILARVIVPRLMMRVARLANRELFLLAVLGVAGVIANATAAAGLSLPLGAFLAGIALADSVFAHQAMSEVLPLRVVMSCVFFVSVGMLLDPSVVVERPGVVALAFLGLTGLKLISGAAGGLAAGLPWATALWVGLALAQVGEFSFILGVVAQDAGLLDADAMRVFTVAIVLSMAASPLALAAFPRLSAGWRAWRRLAPTPEVADIQLPPSPVLVAGFGVAGRAVVEALEARGVPCVVIERNAETVMAERGRGRLMLYGDATSAEVLEHAGLQTSRGLVVVVSDIRAAHETARVARTLRSDIPLILRTRWLDDAETPGHPEDVTVVCEEEMGARQVASAAVELGTG